MNAHSCPECGYAHTPQPSNEDLLANMREFLDEFKRQFGPIPEEIQEEVRRKWESLPPSVEVSTVFVKDLADSRQPRYSFSASYDDADEPYPLVHNQITHASGPGTFSIDDAKYYQAHKDDEDEWGEPEQAPPARRRLSVMISARFSPDEASTIRNAAAAADESLSQFIRNAALTRSRR